MILRHAAACSLLLALSVQPLAAAPEHRELLRPDGTAISYWVDRPDTPAAGLLLLAQGSGCGPVADSANLATVRAAFPTYAAVMVDKVGVTPDAGIVDGFIDCPEAFHASYTLSLRLADYRLVLDALSAETGGRLVLFGGSEGGLAVAILAAGRHVDATIVLSSALGMNLDDLIRASVPPEALPTIDQGFAEALADPHGDALFAGSTHRFWADILSYDSLVTLLATRGPVLLIQGGRDTSAPVAAARLAADAFASAGSCRLTYWEFPSVDHGMVDPAGHSHMAEIASAAAAWAEAPMPDCDAAQAN